MNTLGSKLPVEITTPSSTPSYSTTIGATLVDESVDELLLSIKVGGAGGHIDLGAFDEHLNVSTTWLDLTYPRKRTSCRNHHCDNQHPGKGRGNLGNRFFRVRLLKPQMHSQRLSSLQMDSLRVPAGDLEGQSGVLE